MKKPPAGTLVMTIQGLSPPGLFGGRTYMPVGTMMIIVDWKRHPTFPRLLSVQALVDGVVWRFNVTGPFHRTFRVVP